MNRKHYLPQSFGMLWRTAICLVMLAPLHSLAQDPFSGPTTTAEPEVVEPTGDPFGRDTPRGSFEGFLVASETFDYKLAAQFLDLRNLPSDMRGTDGTAYAEQLDFVIKRAVDLNTAYLSRREEGDLLDELPEYRDELSRIKMSGGEVILLMQKVPGLDENFIWKVSNATVAQIPELYDEYSYPGWVETIRARIPQDKSVLGVELFKWIIVLGMGAIWAPLFWLFCYGLARSFSSPKSPVYPEVKRLLLGPVLALLIISLTTYLLRELGLGASAQKLFKAGTLSTIVTVWMLWDVIDLVRARRRVKYQAEGRTDAAVLGRPLANALKLVAIVIGIITWMLNAGFNLTTVLAGLGIGGVAVALALQKPLEDLIGAITIYSQQPIVTGDLCRYGTAFGRVEEVGLRTTRIRTLNNTVVSVPNSQVAYGMIENYESRRKILYHPDLPLRYDTSREQIEKIITAMYDMLRANSRLEQSSIRVRLFAFAQNSINIKMRIYVATAKFDTYLEVVQEVNLGVMEVIENAGAHFAQGAQSVFIEGGPQAGQNNALGHDHPNP